MSLVSDDPRTVLFPDTSKICMVDIFIVPVNFLGSSQVSRTERVPNELGNCLKFHSISHSNSSAFLRFVIQQVLI